MKTKEDVQEYLQKKFKELGVEVSKENAWKLYKEAIKAMVDLCLADEKENTVSLSGIGRFEILKVKPRSSKVGVVEFIPRLRFRPSSAINEYLENAMHQVPDPKKLAEVKAKLIADGKIKSNLPKGEKKEATEKKETAKPAPAVKPAPAAKSAAKSAADEF